MTGLRDVSILVTGATGFIGPHLVRRLVSAGARVACLILSEAEGRTLPADVTSHVANLQDASAVRAIVQTVRPALSAKSGAA